MIKNLKEAIDLVLNNLSALTKILVFDIVMYILIHACSQFPLIGSAACFLLGFYAIYARLYLYHQMILEDQVYTFKDIFIKPLLFMDEHVGECIKSLLVYSAALLAALMMTLFTIGLFVVSAQSHFIYMLLYVVLLPGILYVTMYYLYKAEYYLASVISKTHKKIDYRNIRTLILWGIVFLLIPIIGWVMLFLFNLVVPVKILLDTKKD